MGLILDPLHDRQTIFFRFRPFWSFTVDEVRNVTVRRRHSRLCGPRKSGAGLWEGGAGTSVTIPLRCPRVGIPALAWAPSGGR